MTTYMLIAAALAIVFWPNQKSPPVVPVEPKSDAPAPSPKLPRWHDFDVLLEMKESLLRSGMDEAEALKICEQIAPTLLRSKK